MNRITFLISKKFGLDLLIYAVKNHINTIDEVITINDELDSRSKLNEIINVCKENNIKHKVVENNQEFNSYFKNKEIKSDVVFVLGWYWIINEELLKLVNKEFIGIHYSLLPKYRGGSPVVWSMINGDAYTGVTMFCFREGIDDGPIIAQEEVQIGYKDTIGDILIKCDETMLNMLKKYYSRIIYDDYTTFEQDDNLAVYCSNRKEEFGKINWNWSPERINNFIRAQSSPYPGAFCFDVNGNKIRILKSDISNENWCCEPGQIIKIDKINNEVYVGTGSSNPIVIKTILVNDQEMIPSNYFKSIKEILK